MWRCRPGRPGSRRTSQRHHGDRVADLPAGDAGADSATRAGHLVAEDGGVRDPGVHVAVEDVQVGAADAGVGDVDLDVAGRRRDAFALWTVIVRASV